MAALGLAVNLASSVLLARRTNPTTMARRRTIITTTTFAPPYLHVIADALTSVAAIVALTAGKWLGWLWLDPLMAMVGGTIILRWAWGLARDSARVLMDADVPSEAVLDVRRLLEGGGDTRVLDLHVWRLAPGKLGVIATLRRRRDSMPPTTARAWSRWAASPTPPSRRTGRPGRINLLRCTKSRYNCGLYLGSTSWVWTEYRPARICRTTSTW